MLRASKKSKGEPNRLSESMSPLSLELHFTGEDLSQAQPKFSVGGFYARAEPWEAWLIAARDFRAKWGPAENNRVNHSNFVWIPIVSNEVE